MPNRWQVIVELTFDIQHGENEDDARERAKTALANARVGGDIAHYHILGKPKVVFEFDLLGHT